MGFGHRVYKNYDPRAKVMQKSCHEVLGELGIEDDPLLDIAMELERIALADDYFVEKKLFPNVDFSSGIILKAMGIPTSMFTEIGRASWRGRVCQYVSISVVSVSLKKNMNVKGELISVHLNKELN